MWGNRTFPYGTMRSASVWCVAVCLISQGHTCGRLNIYNLCYQNRRSHWQQLLSYWQLLLCLLMLKGSSERPATLNRSRWKRFFFIFVKINSRSTRHQSKCECSAEPGVISLCASKRQWEKIRANIDDGQQGGPCSEAAAAGSSEQACGRCTLEKEFLCLLTDLWEEVSRLNSIRDRETHMESHPAFPETAPHPWYGWFPIHSSPGWAQWLEARGQWQQAPAQCSRCLSPVTTPPSQTPW